MKRLLLLLLLLPIVYADASVETNFEGSLQATGRINEMQAVVNVIPQKSTTQDVTILNTEPAAQVTTDNIQYTWSLPKPGVHKYSYSTRVNVRRPPIKVHTTVKYPIPLNDISEQVRTYLKPTKYVDSDASSIKPLAESIIGSDDELWSVVSKLGIWVKENVQYSLSSIAAETSQSASWTLEHKTGVCDELTTLFIAMNRALGIPARFVKGVAYTDDPTSPQQWSVHGWAEVYFPKYGWVPYDVTFGQFGHIDPLHVVLQTTADPGISSVDVTWRGGDVTLGKIEVTAKLLSLQKDEPQVQVTPEVFKSEIGIGSYNLLAAKVTNPHPYSVTAQMSMAKVQEITVEQGQDRTVILGPKEEDYVFWIFKTNEDLDKEILYTIPLVVYTSFNQTFKTTVKSSVREQTYTQNDIHRQRSLLQDQISKGSPVQSLLNCKAERAYVYVYEKPSITCTLKNPETTPMRDVNVCLNGQCETTTVEPGATETITLPLRWTKAAMMEFNVVARNEKLSQLSTFMLDVRDDPKVVFNIKAPETVGYSEIFDIQITAEQESHSLPQDVHYVLTHRNWNRSFTIQELPKMLTITYDSEELEPYPFILKATWKDELGLEYEHEQRWETKLGDLNWFQKAARFFGKFFKSIGDAFF